MSQKIRIQSAASLAFAALLLAACGSEQKPAEPPPLEDTAFRDMAGAMDKARGAEVTLQQGQEARDRKLQEQENPTAE
jgi:hypothetical protein